MTDPSIRVAWANAVLRGDLAKTLSKPELLQPPPANAPGNAPGYAPVNPPQLGIPVQTPPINRNDLPKGIKFFDKPLKIPSLDTSNDPVTENIAPVPHFDYLVSNRLPASTSHQIPVLEEKGDLIRVGIVGAGCAGLFTAMIFDHLMKEVPGLNIEYDILEAAHENRLGGRLYTEKLGDGDHDYYDVGAMRFPKVPTMQRTFDLFTALGMKDVPSGEKPKPGDLIEYLFNGTNCPSRFNDVQHVGKPPAGNAYNITGVPPEYIDKDPSHWVNLFIDKYKNAILADPESGFKLLMEVDKYSTRQFLSNPNRMYDKDLPSLDYNTIEWLETFEMGSGMYDQAFSETVLEALAFDDKAPWRCIEGGAQQVAKRMSDSLQHGKVTFDKEVSKIGYNWNGDWRSFLKVDFVDGSESKEYAAVFNSATLGAISRMDLRGLNLRYETKQAIRAIGYGPSCKIAVRFKKMWWIKKLKIKGGLGKTDLPIRVCVYPSYNVNDDPDKGGVLLCSYSWGQDAQRIGTLVGREMLLGKKDAMLKDLLCRNLALLHSDNETDYEEMHREILENYEKHHAWDWYSDHYATGAFAYYGPEQFRKLYPAILYNLGDHIIIGEATSAHHAWVVGALESAVRGVYQFLLVHSHDDYVKKALVKYNENKIASPYGPVPAEFSQRKDFADEADLRPGSNLQVIGLAEKYRYEKVILPEVFNSAGFEKVS